jgi:glyoxylase-like metal-dependent hydrolase (beta-lactamase superfamily II)
VTSTRFSVEGFRCTYLVTGNFEFEPAAVLVAPADELAPALEKYGLDSDKVVFPVRSLLVETGTNRVVIDPGGPWEDQHALERVLAAEEIDPASIDTVVISHAHGDHLWAGVRADGSPLFENARYWLQRKEWEHWLSEPNPDPDNNLRSALLSLESRISLVDGDEEIVPGIRSVPTPGHSPGHMAIRIGEDTVYAGDVLFSPPQVEHPDWAVSFDASADQAVSTRRSFLDEIGRSGALVLTCHMPDSGACRIVAGGDGWRWQPEAL